VVFVADSQRQRQDANQESLENLVANLKEQGRGLDQVPYVLQYNKQDLTDAMTVEELEASLNTQGAPSFPTSATQGAGVFEALDALVHAVLADLESRQVFAEERDSTELKLSRTDDALEEQIGRASEQIWRSTVQRALETRDSTPPPALRTSVLPGGAPLSQPATAPSTPPPAPIDAIPSVPPPSVSPATPQVGAGPSWVTLFPEQREALRMLEADLTNGRLTDAIGRAEHLALQILTEVARRSGVAAGAAPGLLALLLGVEGHRWLAFRRLTRRVAEGGPVSERDALSAFAMVLDMRLQAERALV
jgi:hypothetical protein